MQIGPYRVREVLGEGGMGVVYRAWDVELEREVALKVLSESANPERFQREAEAMALVAHPHVVPILATGLDEGGRPWLAMEVVEGPSLAALLGQRRTLSTEEAIQITRDVGSALAELHRLGLLHRDVKPANILLRNGTPLLSDFGLARSSGAERLTQTGQIMGTPGYAAPELLLGGSPESIGPAVDVYGLGATLYTLLTGAPPTQGETLTDALVATASAQPVAPHALNPDVPDALSQLCLRCLEKEATQRPTLDQLLAGLVAEPGRSRNWLPLGLGALTLIGVLGGVGLIRGSSAPEPTQASASPGAAPEETSSARPTPRPEPSPDLMATFEAMEHRLRRKEVAAARRVLARAEARGCSESDRRILRARLQLHARRYPKVVETLAPIRDADSSGLAFFLLGRSHSVQRNHLKALAAFERALSVRPEPWFRIQRARSAIVRRQWEIAKSDMKALQGPIPNWLVGERETVHALLLYQLGETAKGLEVIRQVIASHGSTGKRLALLGRLLEAEGRDLPEAKRVLDQALASKPRDLTLWTARIRVALMRADADDAKRMLDQAEGLPRVGTKQKRVFTVARMWLSLLEGTDPQQLEQQLLRFRPRGVESQILAARLCLLLNQRSRARELLERVAVSNALRLARQAKVLLANTRR